MSGRRLASLIGLAWGLAVAATAQETVRDTARDSATGRLPASVVDVFLRAQVPPDSVAIMVKEAGAKEVLIAHNAERAMNPASVIKLVTTFAGLELLGPAYTWKTEALAVGDLRGGTLLGDLVLKGTGDPKLGGDRLIALLRQLRERGLATIRGDLVLDKTAFEPIAHDPAAFDGEPLKAYNAGPDALLVNGKAIRFLFAPSFDGSGVAISPDLNLSQLEVVNRLRLAEGACGEWQNRVILDVQTPSPTQLRVAFTGPYPKSCGERAWSVAVLDPARFTGGAFARAWADLGGAWHGAVKLAAAPAEARLLAATESAPLAEIVRDINKYSNNVMARQLFLALSGDGTEPAGIARSTARVREWLQRKGIAAPELVLENGSGLSRNERISAQTLAALLDAAWKSPVMPEFMSSMPLAGVDGTLRRRVRGEPVAGQAHLKGGTLNDARALAGYVLDVNGRRWIVAILVNHPNAGLTQAAQDALLRWVVQGAPKGAATTAAGW